MIKNRLKHILKTMKITNTKVSKDTGISVSEIGKLSNNIAKTISLETLDKLCEYLEVNIEDILERD